MSIIEVIFSIFMIILPIIILVTKKNILPYYSLMVIGSNPYVTAFTLLIALLVKIQVLLKEKMNKYFFFLSSIWISYGFIIGIYNFSSTFISEFIQLFIGLLFSIYIYNSINSLRKLITIFKILVYSGFILSLLEIFLEIFNININTYSFIGKGPENYTAFYLVITTILIPLCLKNRNYFWLIVIPVGLYAIIINESRAMLALSLLLIFKEFIHVNTLISKILVFTLIFVLMFIIVITFDSNAIYNANSIFSILNFENNFSNLERINLLLYSYEVFMSTPLGHGLGSSYELIINNNLTINTHYPHPHNTLAFFAIELGLVGIIIYTYFIYILFINQRQIKNDILKKFSSGVTISLLLFSIVDVLFYNGVLSLFIFSLFSLVLVSKKVDKIC